MLSNANGAKNFQLLMAPFIDGPHNPDLLQWTLLIAHSPNVKVCCCSGLLLFGLVRCC
jgi:hypothetical protein